MIAKQSCFLDVPLCDLRLLDYGANDVSREYQKCSELKAVVVDDADQKQDIREWVVVLTFFNYFSLPFWQEVVREKINHETLTYQDVQDVLRRVLFVELSQQTPQNGMVASVYDNGRERWQLGRLSNEVGEKLLDHKQDVAN